MSRRSIALAVTALALMAGLVLAACGGSTDEGSGTADPTPAASSPTISEPEPEPTREQKSEPAPQPEQEPTPEPAVEERLQALVDAAVSGDIPGAILEVNSPVLGVNWSGAAGWISLDDREPLRPEHAFRTASITKMVTAATVLLLAEQGALGLDDLISEYLPTELVERVHVVDRRSRGRMITVRQLLAHTAGLYDYVTDDGFVDTVLADPGAVWAPNDLVDYALENGDPYFEPGQGYHYSDTGYVLLGLIVERVSAKPLHEVYQGLVFEPLAMRDTYQEGYEEPRGPELSHPYFEEIDAIVVNGTVDWASGGLVSTAEDLRRFVRGVLEGRLFERAETLDAMFELTPEQSGRGYRFSYGLGIQTLESDGLELQGHDGFWGSFMWYWPELDATITGTVNQSEADQFDLVLPVVELLAELAVERSQGTP